MDEKDCEGCKNYLENGVCMGNSKNELVDQTGEKKCFEGTDFLDRMMIEGKELDKKLFAAQLFLEKDECREEPMLDEMQTSLLQAQTTAMATYSNILLMRVNYERKKRDLPTIAHFN